MIDPSFQGVDRFLSFAKNVPQRSHKRYFLSIVEMKDYNVMIDGRNFSDQPVENEERTCSHIWKITNCQGDYYTPGCLIDYTYLTKHYRTIAITLSGKQALDADPK